MHTLFIYINAHKGYALKVCSQRVSNNIKIKLGFRVKPQRIKAPPVLGVVKGYTLYLYATVLFIIDYRLYSVIVGRGDFYRTVPPFDQSRDSYRSSITPFFFEIALWVLGLL